MTDKDKGKGSAVDPEKTCGTCFHGRTDRNRPDVRLCYFWKSSWGPRQMSQGDTCGMHNFRHKTSGSSPATRKYRKG